MGTVLTFAVSAYFFIISHRLKFAFFFFVFLVPFLPKYIGLGVGGEGFALSLKRILLMILFMWTTASLTQNWEYISKRIFLVYQQNKILINILLLFFILKVFSLSINSRELSQYIALFDDFLVSIFLVVLIMLLIDSEESINRLVKIFFYGYTIMLILVLLETIVNFPMLSIFSSGEMQITRDASAGFSRGGAYRAVGTFSNPIVLGNYLVVLLPLITTYMYKNKYSLIFKIVYLIFTVYAIYATGSRSAILLLAVMIYIYITLILYRGNKLTRFIVIVINLIFVSIVFYFVVNYISDLITNFSGRFDLVTDAEERSSISRAVQYVAIYDKMHEAPFFGFGRERNFTSAFSEHIELDNYYFWTVLEVGIIGLAVYFLFLYILVNTALRLYKLPYKNDYLLPLLVSIIILISYQVLSAVKDMHVYLYIFAGLISVMKVLQIKKEEKALKKDLI